MDVERTTKVVVKDVNVNDDEASFLTDVTFVEHNGQFRIEVPVAALRAVPEGEPLRLFIFTSEFEELVGHVLGLADGQEEGTPG